MLWLYVEPCVVAHATSLVSTHTFNVHFTCRYYYFRLPVICIEPVTEWMEQERTRIEHEAAKQRYKERSEQQQAQALQAQQQASQQPQPPKLNVNRGHLVTKTQNDKSVVGKYKVIKRGDNDHK